MLISSPLFVDDLSMDRVDGLWYHSEWRGMITMDIGKIIRRRRTALGMTQAILREVKADGYAAFQREAPGWEVLKRTFGGEGTKV